VRRPHHTLNQRRLCPRAISRLWRRILRPVGRYMCDLSVKRKRARSLRNRRFEKRWEGHPHPQHRTHKPLGYSIISHWLRSSNLPPHPNLLPRRRKPELRLQLFPSCLASLKGILCVQLIHPTSLGPTMEILLAKIFSSTPRQVISTPLLNGFGTRRQCEDFVCAVWFGKAWVG
jgi:hypothetical protein